MKSLMFNIEDNGERIFYYIYGDKDRGYGFEITQVDESKLLSKESACVFKSKSKAERFLKAMYEERVYPVHLKDIIEDEAENINKMA